MGSAHTSLDTVLFAPGVKENTVTALSNGGLAAFILSVISNATPPEEKRPFYVLDLGVVVALVDAWSHALPSVQPFYAVKCNPHPALLSALAALGANFDCASRAEIESVLALGVSPGRIVYANPCKEASHIKYAASVGVNVTTFDSICEVDKIRTWHPQCSLLIRIKPPDDSGARCPLGPKYGALPEEIEPLLKAADAADIAVTGVSFHIGSGEASPQAYRGAIAAAKSTFDMADRLGMPPMTVLNIGGGFTAGPNFESAAEAVRSAIESYFPDRPGLRVIAEPGRFFAESAFTLATAIIGKRVRGEVREYWINDGVYGSMNCILYDHATVEATPLASASNAANPTCGGRMTYASTVFGPTCDALDTVMTDRQLPDLEMNDWLVFPCMGAYTAAAGSSFNGFDTASIPTHLAYSDPAF